MKGSQVKKVAKVAYMRFDMCVSTLFSPFAGVLYTVSVFEKSPEKPVAARPVSHEAPWAVETSQ